MSSPNEQHVKPPKVKYQMKELSRESEGPLWRVLKKFYVPGMQNARGQAPSNYTLMDHGDLVIQVQLHVGNKKK